MDGFRIGRCLPIHGLLAFAFVLGPGSAHAEPLDFSSVQLAYHLPQLPNQTGFVDLFEQPGATVVAEDGDISIFVTIAGALPPGGTDILRLTLASSAIATVVQEIPIPLPGFDTPPPFTVLPRFFLPTLYQPVPFLLTVDLLGSAPDFTAPSGPQAGARMDSYTYEFSVVQPVPEPASVALVATGLGIICNATRRRRRC